MSRALIFSDLHIGLKSDSISRLNIVKTVVNHIEQNIKKFNIDTIFFLGDLFHTRSSLNVNTINEAITIVNNLAKLVKDFYLIVGNHDIYYKNDTTVNSIKIFNEVPHVKVISAPTAINYNGKDILLVPWMHDLSKYENESFDILMGHFDIPSNYIIKSYIKNNTSKNVSAHEIVSDILKNELIGINAIPQVDEIKECMNDNSSDEPIGNFIHKVKKNGVVYSGHIHKRDVFNTHNRKFIFVGAPYQQTLGDINTKTGYIILDDDMIAHKVDIENIPTHYILKNSSILTKGVDNFDFSVLKNKILKRIIDIPGNREEASKIAIAISTVGIYEELPPEYDLQKTLTESDENSSELGEMIKKSKTDYIKKYINTIDKNILKEKNIDSDKLFEIIKNYISQLNEEKAME